MNFKNFNQIGNSEPRAWNTISGNIGTKFGDDNDDDDENEVPVPYCDEFDDEESEEEEEEEEDEETVTETETETDTDSVGSKKKCPLKRTRCMVPNTVFVVLQEELDFMVE